MLVAALVSDSRCPVGVRCIHAGEAVPRFEPEADGRARLAVERADRSRLQTGPYVAAAKPGQEDVACTTGSRSTKCVFVKSSRMG
jgi:hypothetical protein